jgi:hypothetical protein
MRRRLQRIIFDTFSVVAHLKVMPALLLRVFAPVREIISHAPAQRREGERWFVMKVKL